MTASITSELCIGLDARRLLADPWTAIERADKEGPPFSSALRALYSWLTEGRRTVVIDSSTVDRLLAAPAPTSLPESDPVDIVFQTPISCEFETPRRVAGGIAWRDPGQGWCFLPALLGESANPQLLAVAPAASLVEGAFPTSARVVRAVLRALADQRTHSLGRASGSQRRAARKTGATVGRLVLSDDALSVSRMVRQAGGTRAAGDRAGAAAHVVRAHGCKVWVLCPREGEEVFGVRGQLHCVVRPRRGHVRGGGAFSGGRVVVLRVERS